MTSPPVTQHKYLQGANFYTNRNTKYEQAALPQFNFLLGSTITAGMNLHLKPQILLY